MFVMPLTLLHSRSKQPMAICDICARKLRFTAAGRNSKNIRSRHDTVCTACRRRAQAAQGPRTVSPSWRLTGIVLEPTVPCQHARAYTRANTDARTYARTHARTHAHFTALTQHWHTRARAFTWQWWQGGHGSG